MPGSGTLVVNASDSNLAAVLERGCWSAQVTFGAPGANWSGRWTADDRVVVERDQREVANAPWSLPGAHNASNAAAACAAVAAAGVATDQLAAGLASFSGVRRRAETVQPSGAVTVIDDFAHHPTAVRGTLEGLRKRATGRLLAVVELRSNTMKTGVHAADLEAAVAVADQAFLCAPAAVSQAHYRLPLARDAGALVSEVCRSARSGDTIAVMSNGGFDNFSRRLADCLCEQVPE